MIIHLVNNKEVRAELKTLGWNLDFGYVNEYDYPLLCLSKDSISKKSVGRTYHADDHVFNSGDRLMTLKNFLERYKRQMMPLKDRLKEIRVEALACKLDYKMPEHISELINRIIFEINPEELE